LEPPSFRLTRKLQLTGAPFKVIPARAFRPDLGRNARRHILTDQAVAAAAATTTSRRPLGRSSRATPARLSCCHRALHGPCCILATLGHVPRQALAGRRCPPLHAVSRPHGSRRHFVPSRSMQWPHTTFRCVVGAPTLSASSRLRRSLNPVPASASGLCHRTCLKPSSAPSPPALPPRNPH